MTQPTVEARERAVADFVSRHGCDPSFVACAPGRVNLIGEHTDYNDGLVLPLALPYATVIAASPLDDDRIEVASEGFGMAELQPTTLPKADPAAPGTSWTIYLEAMTALLRQHSDAVGGWRGCIATDIPAGAGLSSSAALEVAAGLAGWAAATPGGLPDRDLLALLAALGTRVENEALGLPSGIMDQMISALALDGAALLIDCETKRTDVVPIPDDAVVVVLDTGTRRQLVDSEFAARRADCEQAAAVLGVASLREVDDEDDLAPLAELDDAEGDRLYRRARHVVNENGRTAATAEALTSGDLAAAGALMAASHRSLADLYEVSGPALDAIVAAAGDGPGCYGARMTGGGFAGCAVALVEADATDAFVEHVKGRYQPPAGSKPSAMYAVRPSGGATVTWLADEGTPSAP